MKPTQGGYVFEPLRPYSKQIVHKFYQTKRCGWDEWLKQYFDTIPRHTDIRPLQEREKYTKYQKGIEILNESTKIT